MNGGAIVCRMVSEAAAAESSPAPPLQQDSEVLRFSVFRSFGFCRDTEVEEKKGKHRTL